MQRRLESDDSLRAIGRSLGRSPSTISRECRRSCVECSGYKAQTAQQRSQACRKKPRVTRKLDDAALWEAVQALLRASSASAADALESFGNALKGIPQALRKTLTYDQGKEMSYHAALTIQAEFIIPS